MRAEVLAIGDELITGQRLDTNSQWLSQRLTESGVDVAFHSTVGDDLDDNIAAFRLAIERSDVIVCTGGLGPTADDLTRQAVAAATGVELVRDETSLVAIRALFAGRGRSMPERNEVQADFPEGSTPIPNQHGTAPGIAMAAPRTGREPCWVFALPGVPAELKPMWSETVQPKILSLQAEPRVTTHYRIKSFGMGESQLEAMLPDMIARNRDPLVGITASDATITLRITASGSDRGACLAVMQPTIDEIHEILGDLVFGDEEDELEDAVARLLADQRAAIAVAEWATGGLVTQRLCEGGAPASGVVISSHDQLEKLLNVPRDAASPASEADVAAALAVAVRQRADVAVGVGVAAFPKPVDAPNALLRVAVATPQATKAWKFPCASHPAILKSRAAKQVLNAVRLTLQRAPLGEPRPSS